MWRQDNGKVVIFFKIVIKKKNSLNFTLCAVSLMTQNSQRSAWQRWHRQHSWNSKEYDVSIYGQRQKLLNFFFFSLHVTHLSYFLLLTILAKVSFPLTHLNPPRMVWWWWWFPKVMTALSMRRRCWVCECRAQANESEKDFDESIVIEPLHHCGVRTCKD